MIIGLSVKKNSQGIISNSWLVINTALNKST